MTGIVATPQSLATIEQATKMLAGMTNLEDVRTIKDQAEAMRVYARQHKLGLEAQNHAGKIAIEAEIRQGEILRAMAEMGQRAGLGDGAKGTKGAPLATLADLNVTKRESSNAQAMALAADEVRKWAESAKTISPGKAAKVAKAALYKAEVQAAPPLPTGIYNVLVADPPWSYSNSGGLPGQAENHYAAMSLDELKQMPLPQLADDAALFLWATNPLLPEALELVRAWGFNYKTNVVWVKTELQKPGVGFYVRGRHELLLICTRGRFVPDQTGRSPVGSVISAPIGEHSRKPDEAYALIESIYPEGTYVELFARRSREGWATWGSAGA